MSLVNYLDWCCSFNVCWKILIYFQRSCSSCKSECLCYCICVTIHNELISCRNCSCFRFSFRHIKFCSICSSCYFIFHDWRRVIFGFVTLFIIGVVLDWIINSARQSVQFFIFSKKYDEIADRIIKDADRGVTVLDGTGWYSKANVKVLVVLAKKRQSLDIFRLVKRIDPNAFISQSSVIGVYGEGFEKLKVK